MRFKWIAPSWWTISVLAPASANAPKYRSGSGDHQARTSRGIGVTGRSQRTTAGPKRDIGDEVPVHDVDVNPVGMAAATTSATCVGQMPHVGRQDRRGELDVVGKYTHESRSSLANPADRTSLSIEYHDTRATSKVRSSSGLSAGEQIDGLDRGADDLRCIEATSPQDLIEPSHAELNVFGIHGFGNPVGIDRQDVARNERQRRLFVLELVKKPLR